MGGYAVNQDIAGHIVYDAGVKSEGNSLRLHIFTRQHRIWLLMVGAGALVVVLFFVLGYRSCRTAANLRDEICKLELGKSSFEEVSRLAHHYGGLIFTHDDLPATCSPNSCVYLMVVEDPLSKLIKIGPRTALVGRVVVSENVLTKRELVLGRRRWGRELEVVVGQSSELNWNGDARIAKYSKVETVEVRLPAHAIARFTQLADELNLSCLATVLGCDGADDILPFLKERAGEAGKTKSTY